MGSDSSKPSKNNTNNNNNVQDSLKFGPSIESARNSQYSLNRDQIVQASTKVNPQAPSIPPPAYTKTDPLQASNNVGNLLRTSQNIQQSTTTATKTGSQISDLKSKQTSASEIGNVAILNKQKVIELQMLNSSAKPTTINFDQEVQKSKNIHTENDTATAINKELNRNKSLSEVRKLLVNNEYLSDVKFILNSTVYYGHKLFLVTSSPLFYEHFQVNGMKEMKVDGIDENIFLAMLNFCYTGTLHKLTDDNILTTLLAADQLKISQAYTTCCGFVNSKINPDGVFVVLEKALDLGNEQFQKKCLDYIKKNEEKCFSSKGFFNIGLASLVTMLEKCEYPTEKLNEIVEKWNHGPIIPDVKPTNSPAAAQNKGKKKKENPQSQQQQVQNNQKQTQKSQNQQQEQKVQQNQQQKVQQNQQQKVQQNQQQKVQQNQQQKAQQNQQQQSNMQHFQQQSMPHFPQQFQQQNIPLFPFPMQQFPHPLIQTIPNMQHIQQQQQQQKNHQQSPKNAGQKGKNKQNQPQNKKQGTGIQNIPNLIDLDIPPPPFAEGYHGNLGLFPTGSSMRHADSMSNLSDDLMSFGGDDDDRINDLNGLVCVDDEDESKFKIIIRGAESVSMTEFARIDFVAKRSFMLNEVWFNHNLIATSNEFRLTIAVFENETRSDIHSRTIKGASNKRCNFIKFSRQPLKIFVGQKFFIKINFAKAASRKCLLPQSLSSSDFLELRKDDEVRKYFNCINKLVVSEMT